MENVKLVLSSDRISNLPNNVEEKILMCLPTRDAVRTCIFSRKWRHVWTKIPQFVLDQQFWENVDKQHSAEIKLSKILYQLFLHHDGPINKFILSNPELTSCTEIGNLIFFLAKNHLEDFTLEMWKDCYLLPSSFFSCDKLKSLRLRSCSIRSSYQIFNRLTTLTLIEVTISAEMLESLISGSPLHHSPVRARPSHSQSMKNKSAPSWSQYQCCALHPYVSLINTIRPMP
ncbi:hypothetical protein Leryth_020493 [Lithospermum erythrorhizon]|nr:hypothetical protein Leryth_020493 [Lithospermum erythrorhizon]